MAYTIGTAANIGDLQTAIFNACVASGWTLSGTTLSKSPQHVQIDLLTTTGVNGATGLRLRGGTGVSGGTVTGGAPYASDVGTVLNFALQYPLTYFIFVFADPDEVYIVVQYNVDHFQWAAWGRSSLSLPASGMWFGASIRSYNLTVVSNPLPLDIGNNSPTYNVGYASPGLFLRNQDALAEGLAECHILHGLDGASWTTGGASAPHPSAFPSASQLLGILPSAWNSESVLLPIQPTVIRPSNRLSIVASLNNARYLRIDNYNPGDLITLGSEQWIVFPWYRKNSVARSGMASPSSDVALMHSGTFGWAIRYEGP